tara:strand:- start:2633 stop:3043 length:411 start_codon:yes stop_codon:yes gene_type:complete
LQFARLFSKLSAVTEPLALCVYERMLPGSQLLVKLQDLGYHAHHTQDIGQVISEAEEHGPIIVLLDLVWRQRDPLIAINQLANNPKTEHLPVIAFANMESEKLLERALIEGASLVTGDDGILQQLKQLLDQAMDFD